MFVSKKKYEELERRFAECKRREDNLRWQLDDQIRQNCKKADTLQYILEQETTSPNATMQRVLNAVKEALGR